MWIEKEGVDKMRLPRKEAEKKKSQRVRDCPCDLQPRSFKHTVVIEQSWGSREGTEALQRKPWKPVAIQICFLSNHMRQSKDSNVSLTINRKLSPSLKLLVSLRQKLAHAKDPEDKLDSVVYGCVGQTLLYIYNVKNVGSHMRPRSFWATVP